jgi:4'-phosphopantetheinyl transferase
MDDLGPSDVHLWFQPTTAFAPADAASALAWLSPDERARHARFVFPEDARDYAAAHLLLRQALSRYEPVAPSAWTFDAEPGGKPRLIDNGGQPTLSFNLSHTRGLVACAIAREGDIGVDVERLDRAIDDREISRRFFSDREHAWLERQDPAVRPARFVELWTLKEAYLKATGLGLATPLDAFSILWDGDAGLVFDGAPGDDLEAWSFALYAPSPDTRLAVAIRSAGRGVARQMIARSADGVGAALEATRRLAGA